VIGDLCAQSPVPAIAIAVVTSAIGFATDAAGRKIVIPRRLDHLRIYCGH